MNIITNVVSKYHEAYVEHRIRCKDGSSILVFCLGSLVMENGQTKSVIRIVDMSNSLIMINQSRKISSHISTSLFSEYVFIIHRFYFIVICQNFHEFKKLVHMLYRIF